MTSGPHLWRWLGKEPATGTTKHPTSQLPTSPLMCQFYSRYPLQPGLDYLWHRKSSTCFFPVTKHFFLKHHLHNEHGQHLWTTLAVLIGKRTLRWLVSDSAAYVSLQPHLMNTITQWLRIAKPFEKRFWSTEGSMIESAALIVHNRSQMLSHRFPSCVCCKGKGSWFQWGPDNTRLW